VIGQLELITFYPGDYAQLANDIHNLSNNVIAMAITYQASDDQWVKEYHQIQRHARMKGKLRGQSRRYAD